MHGVKPDTDLSPLLGKRVESILFSRFQVIIHLEDRLFISLEAECSFEQGDSIVRREDYRPLANSFAELLGHCIDEAKVVSADTIEFEFSNGVLLSIFDSNERYESFQIQLPGQLLVV
jgi:hypothetical protein